MRKNHIKCTFRKVLKKKKIFFFSFFLSQLDDQRSVQWIKSRLFLIKLVISNGELLLFEIFLSNHFLFYTIFPNSGSDSLREL